MLIFCCTFLPQKRFLLALFWRDTESVSMYLTGCIWCRPPCSHLFWSAYVSWRAERWVWSSRGVLWLVATVGLRAVVQNCLFRVAELLLWLSSQICHVVFRWPSVLKAEETCCSLLLAKRTGRPHAFVFWCISVDILTHKLFWINTLLSWSPHCFLRIAQRFFPVDFERMCSRPPVTSESFIWAN